MEQEQGRRFFGRNEYDYSSKGLGQFGRYSTEQSDSSLSKPPSPVYSSSLVDQYSIQPSFFGSDIYRQPVYPICDGSNKHHGSQSFLYSDNISSSGFSAANNVFFGFKEDSMETEIGSDPPMFESNIIPRMNHTMKLEVGTPNSSDQVSDGFSDESQGDGSRKAPQKQQEEGEKEVEEEEDKDASKQASISEDSKKQVKANRKKGEKRMREPKVALITKSEVEHLEDGYRWRKYGQKAVKNSPFPRNYYRCTNVTCRLRKQVERCAVDPSLVMTTYEGRHTHPSPTALRYGTSPCNSFNSDRSHPSLLPFIGPPIHFNPIIPYPSPSQSMPTLPFFTQQGLLQDMLHYQTSPPYH